MDQPQNKRRGISLSLTPNKHNPSPQKPQTPNQNIQLPSIKNSKISYSCEKYIKVYSKLTPQKNTLQQTKLINQQISKFPNLIETQEIYNPNNLYLSSQPKPIHTYNHPQYQYYQYPQITNHLNTQNYQYPSTQVYQHIHSSHIAEPSPVNINNLTSLYQPSQFYQMTCSQNIPNESRSSSIHLGLPSKVTITVNPDQIKKLTVEKYPSVSIGMNQKNYLKQGFQNQQVSLEKQRYNQILTSKLTRIEQPKYNIPSAISNDSSFSPSFPHLHQSNYTNKSPQPHNISYNLSRSNQNKQQCSKQQLQTSKYTTQFQNNKQNQQIQPKYSSIQTQTHNYASSTYNQRQKQDQIDRQIEIDKERLKIRQKQIERDRERQREKQRQRQREREYERQREKEREREREKLKQKQNERQKDRTKREKQYKKQAQKEQRLQRLKWAQRKLLQIINLCQQSPSL